MTRVKICCISSVEEAELAISYGASALGLVGKMPSGPGPIEDELIRTIAASVPPPLATFLLTSEISARGIIDHHHRTYTSTIQIVDELSDGTYDAIKEALPAVRLVQVIHVMDDDAVEEAIRIAEHVDAILLDSGNPKLAVKELGGTGRVHDWKISRRIKESISIPLFLAGGLNADNVAEAIAQVQPFAVDVCSGVRTDGKLDERKLAQFMRAIRIM